MENKLVVAPETVCSGKFKENEVDAGIHVWEEFWKKGTSFGPRKLAFFLEQEIVPRKFWQETAVVIDLAGFKSRGKCAEQIIRGMHKFFSDNFLSVEIKNVDIDMFPYFTDNYVPSPIEIEAYIANAVSNMFENFAEMDEIPGKIFTGSLPFFLEEVVKTFHQEVSTGLFAPDGTPVFESEKDAQAASKVMGFPTSFLTKIN